MKYLKKYQDKIFESKTSDLLHKVLGDIVYEIEEDMQTLREILLEINDLGVETNVSFTPISYTKFLNGSWKMPTDKIRMYVDIHPSKENIANMEIIDEVVKRCVHFLEGKSYDTRIIKYGYHRYKNCGIQINFSKK